MLVIQIPISMSVNLDMAKLVYTFFMMKDKVKTSEWLNGWCVLLLLVCVSSLTNLEQRSM